MAGQLLTSVLLTITPEMMPSFRFLAYYSIPWRGREEVVPDSIWVDVEDSCAGGVRLSKDNIFIIIFLCLGISVPFIIPSPAPLLYCAALFFSSILKLKVGPVDGIPRDYTPGKTFNFQVRGDPGSKVGLVAVDNAVFLLNKDRLTQRKVCFLHKEINMSSER